jgi:hypothetical protein
MIGFGSMAGGFGSRTILGVPVDPDGPEAQQWLREELAKAPYQAAKPTWFDRLSQSFLDWITSITAPSGNGFEAWLPLVLTILAGGVVVAAFLLFGLPRRNRRSSVGVGLFAENDQRSAGDLRRSALSSAASGDWNTAVEDMFRALARGLAERTLVGATPGTTAHLFARQAGAVFPDQHERLAAAAAACDDVRYLGRNAGRADFTAMAELDRDLGTSRPQVGP